ncbi:hypothetical protein D9M68_782730 [compost metagenome]
MALHEARGLHRARGHQRADAQAVDGVERQHVHARDLLDIDHLLGLAHGLLDLDQQVRAAGQHAGLAAAPVQHGRGFRQRCRFEIFKRSHCSSWSVPSASACRVGRAPLKSSWADGLHR